jgi:hypothetical protein
MLLFEALAQILARLEEQGAKAALLGGLAVSAWTEPRFTRDVDLAVAAQSDADAERLVHQLQQRGYGLLATVEQTLAGRLATARLLPPGENEEGMIVDLLFASSGIEPEIVAAASSIDIGASTAVCIARPGHLVALKLLAYDAITRPQDALDLRALKMVIDSEEVQLARDACLLIMQRGYHRGRELTRLLDAFLAG